MSKNIYGSCYQIKAMFGDNPRGRRPTALLELRWFNFALHRISAAEPRFLYKADIGNPHKMRRLLRGVAAMTGISSFEAAWNVNRFAYLRQCPDEARTFDAMMATFPDKRHASIAVDVAQCAKQAMLNMANKILVGRKLYAIL